MIASAKSPWFQFKVNLWAKLTGRSPIDWKAFIAKLESSEFREFKNVAEAMQSFGWAKAAGYKMGLNPKSGAYFPGGVDPEDLFIKYARRVPTEGNYFDFYVHAQRAEGGGLAFSRLSAEGALEEVSAADLAIAVHDSGWKSGEPVRLFSCGVGDPALGANCPAQQLADLLGVDVKAPTQAIHLFENGDYVINNAQNATQGVTKNTGTWKIFSPIKK